MRNVLPYLLMLILLADCGNNPSTAVDNEDATTIQPAAQESNGLPVFSETKDASGKVISSGYLLNEQKESTWIEYYESGVPKTLTTFYHGKKEGIAIDFTTNGSIAKRVNYHNDLREGDYREYNYGNVHEERTYVNGKIEGIVKIYYDNNLKVMEEGSYRNGVRDGVSKWYDQNGNVTIEYTYKNGELVKK